MKKLLIVVLVLLSTGGVSMANQEYDQMLYPVVRLFFDDWNASGVVVYAGEGHSLILTVGHAVQGEDEVNVVLYPSNIVVPGKVVKIGKKHDLALVRINVEHKYVAKRGSAKKLLLFMETWKVGCGLNKPPFPTKGIISAFDAELGTMQTDANIILGDSGGAFFIKQGHDYRLAGVVVGMAVVRGKGGVQLLPHIAYGFNLYAIEQFLKEE